MTRLTRLVTAGLVAAALTALGAAQAFADFSNGPFDI
jgi:hypothetical protein